MRKPRKPDLELMGIEMLALHAGGESPAGIIDHWEKRGHSEMSSSEGCLPTKMNGGDPERSYDETDFATMGITLGDTIEDDPLFREAKLPVGWSMRPHDNDMNNYWTDVLDTKGRERVHIFYKAAAWDRVAHMSPVPRFTISNGAFIRWAQPGDDPEDYSDHPGDDDIVVADNTQKPPRVRVRFEVTDKKTEERDAGREKARAWLDEHYPEWHNAGAHWDDE